MELFLYLKFFLVFVIKIAGMLVCRLFRKDAEVKKPISTGSGIADFMISQIPGVGKVVKLINTPPQVGAHIAHGINAYRESCGSRRKK